MLGMILLFYSILLWLWMTNIPVSQILSIKTFMWFLCRNAHCKNFHIACRIDIYEENRDWTEGQKWINHITNMLFLGQSVMCFANWSFDHFVMYNRNEMLLSISKSQHYFCLLSSIRNVTITEQNVYTGQGPNWPWNNCTVTVSVQHMCTHSCPWDWPKASS